MISKIKRLIFSDTSKDTLVSLVGNGLVALSGTLFTILVARGMTPPQFGTLSALLALAFLLSSLGDLGISSALINFIPKLKSERNTIVSLSFVVQSAVAIILIIVFYIGSFWHEVLVPGSTNYLFFITSLVSAFAVISGFAKNLLKAERKFVYASIIQVLESVVKLIPVGILYFYFSLSINDVLLSVLSAIILASIFALYKEFKNITIVFPKYYFKKIFHFTKWVAIMRGFSVAISRVDVILLNALGTNHQAGIYAAASRITMLFALLVSSLGSVVAPRFSSFNKRKQVTSYIKKISLLIGGVSILMVLSILLSPLIVNTVFGSQYAAAIPVFRYLTLAMIPFLLSIITTNPLIYFFNKPNFTALATAIQVGLLVVIEVILIPTMGPMAPTIALAVSNTVVLILTGWKLKKLL